MTFTNSNQDSRTRSMIGGRSMNLFIKIDVTSLLSGLNGFAKMEEVAADQQKIAPWNLKIEQALILLIFTVRVYGNAAVPVNEYYLNVFGWNNRSFKLLSIHLFWAVMAPCRMVISKFSIRVCSLLSWDYEQYNWITGRIHAHDYESSIDWLDNSKSWQIRFIRPLTSLHPRLHRRVFV